MAGRGARVVVGATVPLPVDVLVNAVPCRLLPGDSPLPEVPRRKGVDSFYVQAEIPAGVLHDGWNAVELFNQGTEHTIEAHEIVWMEVTVGSKE